MARASGERRKHSGLRRHAAYTNSTDATITKAAPSRLLIAPRGISRVAVRGFSASYRASTSRLNPIAADRAATIATRIHNTTVQVIGDCREASSAPAKANGSANTEWLNRTNDR